MWGLLDPHVQGPRVGVSTHNSYFLNLCSTPRALARLGGGISCHFLGQAGPCVLKLLADICLPALASPAAAAGSLSQWDFE